jgi:hypothetical protein
VPHQEQVVEHYWGWCKAWIVPYPCRKTRTVTKWCYDFSYLTVDYHYVYTNYVGCEVNALYSWRQFELSFRGEAFTLYFLTKCYDDRKESTGSCSPENALVELKRILGGDFDKILQGKARFGESDSASESQV